MKKVLITGSRGVTIESLDKLQPMIHDEKREAKAFIKLRKSIKCTYCAMPAAGSCVNCNLPMCPKHQTIVLNAMYCREHRP